MINTSIQGLLEMMFGAYKALSPLFNNIFEPSIAYNCDRGLETPRIIKSYGCWSIFIESACNGLVRFFNNIRLKTKCDCSAPFIIKIHMDSRYEWSCKIRYIFFSNCDVNYPMISLLLSIRNIAMQKHSKQLEPKISIKEESQLNL